MSQEEFVRRCPICNRREVPTNPDSTIDTHYTSVDFGDDAWWTVLCPASGKTRERAIQQIALSWRDRDRLTLREIYSVEGMPYVALYGDFSIDELLTIVQEMQSTEER